MSELEAAERKLMNEKRANDIKWSENHNFLHAHYICGTLKALGFITYGEYAELCEHISNNQKRGE